MKDRNQWDWFVWGKHPGVADFVCTGTQPPLFQKFTNWVDTGFSKVDAELKVKSRHCSWRFWSKGTGEKVVCGLVRNSCDSYGRSYPLLYLGMGYLADWARNCSLLPFAFEPIWMQFEYVAAARYDSVKGLSDALQLIAPPEPFWRQYQQRIYSAPTLYTQASVDIRISASTRLCKIDCRASEELPQDLCFCSNVVAVNENGTPTAVFIGELGTRIGVAMIDDLLKPSDFAWLWSLRPDSSDKADGVPG
jgi:type VI secretion system ImpM family protein